MTEAFDRVFSEIVEQHQVLSAVDTAIARQLALAVIEDADAAKIIALRNAMPAAVKPRAPPTVDLRRLTDFEFEQLTALLARASDGEVEAWTPPAEPERSPRWYEAERLVSWLDERADELHHRRPTDEEVAELVGLVAGVLYPAYGPDVFWRSLVRHGYPALCGYFPRGEAGKVDSGDGVATAAEAPSMVNVHGLDGLPGSGGLRRGLPPGLSERDVGKEEQRPGKGNGTSPVFGSAEAEAERSR